MTKPNKKYKMEGVTTLDFLLTEEFILDALTTTIIASSAAIIAAIISAVISSRKTNHLVEKNLDKVDSCSKINSMEHKDLSKEHNGLSKEYFRLSKEHSVLSTSIKKALEAINCTEKMMLEEKTKQEFRYNSLTDKQRELTNIADAVGELKNELLRLQGENKQLRSKIEQLQYENESLKRSNERPQPSSYEHEL